MKQTISGTQDCDRFQVSRSLDGYGAKAIPMWIVTDRDVCRESEKGFADEHYDTWDDAMCRASYLNRRFDTEEE